MDLGEVEKLLELVIIQGAADGTPGFENARILFHGYRLNQG